MGTRRVALCATFLCDLLQRADKPLDLIGLHFYLWWLRLREGEYGPGQSPSVVVHGSHPGLEIDIAIFGNAEDRYAQRCVVDNCQCADRCPREVLAREGVPAEREPVRGPPLPAPARHGRRVPPRGRHDNI